MNTQELTPQARQYLKTKGVNLLTEKIFPILTDETIALAPFEGSKSLERTQIVTWIPSKTTLTKATLVISATPRDSPAILLLTLNGYEVDKKEWGWVDLTPYSHEIEVADKLINGLNTLRVTWQAVVAHLIPVTVFGLSLSLRTTYEGLPPGVVGEAWLLYVAIGAVLIVTVVGVVILKRRRR